MTKAEAALSYTDRGFSVIPCGADKKPLVAWLPYQKERPSRKQVEEWWAKTPNANVAVITGTISGVVVVDIDEEQGFKEIAKYIPATIETPTARTPRGGCHIFFQCPDKAIGNNARKIPGCDFRGEGGYVLVAPSENGKGGRYEWMKGLDVPLAVLPEEYISFVSSFAFLYKGGVEGQNQQFDNNQQVRQDSTMWDVGKRDDNLWHTAHCLLLGGMPKHEIFQVLRPIMNAWGEDDEKWINTKIESAITRATRKERNLHQEVSEWVDSTTGAFYSTELESFLHCSTTSDKKNVSVILKRLSKETPPMIEKIPGRNGHWRKVESQLEFIDWKNAPKDEYKIDLPLQIADLCKIYPGNIVVLAGASNTGKTSFLLDTIRLNQETHKIRYLNSEMGGSELSIRLELFNEVIKPDKWTFDALERSSNFADAIDPTGFNVIDFMEVYDDFWKVGGWIRDVHEKLDGGIAIIAIQKKSSTKKDTQNYGRGGELTLEKPRLYLAMDRGEIRIVKAKIWRNHGTNPNGLIRKFNILNGWKLLPASPWESEEEKKYGFVHED